MIQANGLSDVDSQGVVYRAFKGLDVALHSRGIVYLRVSQVFR
jgi:hypothetical protein